MNSVYTIIAMFVAVVSFMVIASAIFADNFVHHAVAHVYRIGSHGTAASNNMTTANTSFNNISAIYTHIHSLHHNGK